MKTTETRRGYRETQRLYPLAGKVCEYCGGPAQVRHHIDGDPTNTDAFNIMLCCHRCHASAHIGRWGRTGRTRLSQADIFLIRRNRNITSSEMAAMMGVNDSYIRKIRRGKRLSTIH